MSLLQLSYELDLSPKRVASTHGGEYHSPCPICGGKDRFIIWEKQGRYLCRQCATKGDEIQFCRDFMGMDYHSACAKLGRQAKTSFRFMVEPPRFTPFHADLPSAIWQRSAKEFVCFAVEQLNDNKGALQGLYERGFSSEGISLFSLGWNPIDRFIGLSEWGLPLSWNEAGREKKVWLPKGIVIPTFTEEKVTKLKIRRSEKDQRPKYIEISGSMKCPSLYGSIAKAVVIVEAELDAMLIQHYAADLCFCMAIGGAGKKPDFVSDALLKQTPTILFALDFDAAGKAAYQFWRSTYPHLRAWPASRGKSPGDALKLGMNLRQWILEGLKTT